MQKKIMKNVRMTKATSTALNVLAAQTGLPIGDLLTALLRFQKAGKYLTRQEDKKLFEIVWGQSVLSAKRAGNSGWVQNPDAPESVVIDADFSEE